MHCIRNHVNDGHVVAFENDQTNHKSKSELNLNHMVADQRKRSNAITMFVLTLSLSFTLSAEGIERDAFVLYARFELNSYESSNSRWAWE